MDKLYFIGNDDRSNILKRMYNKRGMIGKSIEESKYILTGIPFSKDSEYLTGKDIKIIDFLKDNDFKNKVLITFVINDKIKKLLEESMIKYVDVMKFDELAIYNAIPTAEGAICKAILNSKITLSNNNSLVLGYGKTGKVLADKLKGIGSNVSVCVRKEKDLALIRALGYRGININKLDDSLFKYQFIFNTIPYLVLNKDRLNLLNRNVCIIDIASYPGGLDYNYCNKNKVNAKLFLGIPGKVAPITSSKYIANIIDKLMKI